MYHKIAIALILSVISTVSTIAQKTVSELTIIYDISVESKSDNPKMINMFNGATTTIYIKGKSHRTEAVNALGTTTTIYNGDTKTAAVLKEYGAQKLYIKLTKDNWDDANKKYDNITFAKTTETKLIAKYNCTKYIGTLQDGTQLTVYSTTDIVPETKEYNSNQFKNINGLVLEYELTLKDVKLTNTAAVIKIGNVDDDKFALPKTGYRELTYEESKQKMN